MRTEKEIRQHRDDLQLLLDAPCGCEQDGHAYECQQGKILMRSHIRMLDWILGEVEPQSQHGRFMVEIADQAAAIRAEQN
jgi:hypothetical protein